MKMLDLPSVYLSFYKLFIQIFRITIFRKAVVDSYRWIEVVILLLIAIKMILMIILSALIGTILLNSTSLPHYRRSEVNCL